MREKLQSVGGFLAGMVIPNVGAFIAWGLITALFIPTGWIPNENFEQLVGPMILYLLPILIGYTGGYLIYGQRGGVVGAAATMGVVVGAEIPMFLGAMIMGPLGGWTIKKIDELLEDPEVDAVHINTPIPDHAPQSIQALKAGKHVACTVPMATTVKECQEIARISRETGKKYMMMETVVYSREFLFVKELYQKGELGKIQFLQASHQQDMDGWPNYWPGLPPMHYATHVVSPVLGLVKGCAESVSCFGSGTIDSRLAEKSGNAYAVESCHIKVKDSDVAAHIWRFLFDTARQYRESFDVYGTKKSFEWALIEGEEHVIHTAKKPEADIPERVTVPDYAHLLPEEIRAFTQSIQDADHLSFIQGGGHGGSHGQLSNEFVLSILEDRKPLVDIAQALNMTVAGVVAHQSALRDGELMKIPQYKI